MPFFCHWYDNPVPVLAFNVTDPPRQTVVGPEVVIEAVGACPFTLTYIEFETTVPQLFVTNRIYSPLVVTFSVEPLPKIGVETSVALHAKSKPAGALELKVTEPPLQKVVGPFAVIVTGDGNCEQGGGVFVYVAKLYVTSFPRPDAKLPNRPVVDPTKEYIFC